MTRQSFCFVIKTQSSFLIGLNHPYIINCGLFHAMVKLFALNIGLQ